MKKVFLSYSRHNAEVVTKLIHDLRAAGIDIWYDQTLTGGQRWWDNILENIANSDVFVLALSPESWQSEACRSELNYVTKLGKPILPALIADGININLLPAPLNQIQIMDCRRGDSESVFSLIKAIYSTPAAPPLPDPLPAPPPVPVSYLSTLKEQIDSPEPMTAQNQMTLLFEIQKELRTGGRSPVEIRELLVGLKRRDDLLAKIASQIDVELNSLGQNINAQQPTPPPINISQTTEHTFCPKCGKQAAKGQKFCPNCGTMLGDQAREIPEGSGKKSRKFICQSQQTSTVIGDVKGWLDSQGFDSQQMKTENGGELLQIKKRGGWRDFVGMATSLNIVFYQSGDTLTVQIGSGKWVDKAAVGTVSLFILWPLAITAGFGAWEQMKMPEKIFDYIGSRLHSK
jgi:ribosomal protein L37E